MVESREKFPEYDFSSPRGRFHYVVSVFSGDQKDFAKWTGISPATVSDILRGKREVSYEIAGKAASVYPELELKWLLRGIGKPPPPPGVVREEQPDYEALGLDPEDRKLVEAFRRWLICLGHRLREPNRERMEENDHVL